MRPWQTEAMPGFKILDAMAMVAAAAVGAASHDRTTNKS